MTDLVGRLRWFSETEDTAIFWGGYEGHFPIDDMRLAADEIERLTAAEQVRAQQPSKVFNYISHGGTEADKQTASMEYLEGVLGGVLVERDELLAEVARLKAEQVRASETELANRCNEMAAVIREMTPLDQLPVRKKVSFATAEFIYGSHD